MQCRNDKYKLNFHKWFEKIDLFASLGFAYIINSEGPICLSILPPTRCNGDWFLIITLILACPWQEFLKWFVWALAIMKVFAQPWKTSEVLFSLFCPWLSGSSIRCVFIGSTIKPVFPPKDKLSLWWLKYTSLNQKVQTILWE